MKRILLCLSVLMLTITSFVSLSAQDDNEDEVLSKEILYNVYYSDMTYKEFEELYDQFTENFGVQSVPEEIINQYINGESSKLRTIKTGFYDYFSNVKWVNRTDGVSLQVTWKSYLFDFDTSEDETNQQMYRSAKAWELLKNKFSKDSNWTNTTSMKDQFYCHINYAGRNKNPYNLEPWRPVVSNAEMIKCKCNPS